MSRNDRPAPPHPAPAGHVWAAPVDDRYQWLPEADRPLKCVAPRSWRAGFDSFGGYATPGAGHCNAGAVAVRRAENGGRRQPRCANHLDGGWIEYELVMHWQLTEE